MSGDKPDIRIEHSVSEAWTVWVGDRPVAIYTGADGRTLAEEARTSLLAGIAPKDLPTDPNSSELIPLEQIEREAKHWDGIWDVRDNTLPLADRLLAAATDAGDNKEPESMFQLLWLAKDALRHERRARYGRRYKKGGGTKTLTAEQVSAAKALRANGMSWSKIAEVMKINRSVARAAVIDQEEQCG